MFDSIKNSFSQENDDLLYEYVMEEMEKEEPIKGLWAKALAHSEGNNDKAKSLYIQNRVQVLKNELKTNGIRYKKLSKEQLWKTIQDGFSKQNLNQEVQEETKEKQDEKKYSKFGGWLLFLAFILVIGDLNVFIEALKALSNEHYQNLEVLLSKKHDFFVSTLNIGVYVLLSGVFFNILLTISFFTKANSTKKIAIAYFIWSVLSAVIVLSIFLSQMKHLPKEFFDAIYPPQDVIKEFIRPIGIAIISIIWIFYFIYSKRVKATFIKQKRLFLMIVISAIIPLAMMVYHFLHINQIQNPSMPTSTITKSEGKVKLAPVEINGKWGFIDTKGDLVVKPIYKSANNFSEEFSSVEVDGKWGFIDTKGNLVIKSIFDGANSFSEGLASVIVNGKIGFIDKKGNWVIKPIFDGANSFSEGLAAAESNGKYGFIDKKGNWVIQPIFDMAKIFSEGLASVIVNGKIGFIDKKGNIVIEPIFDFASPFSEGLSRVKLNELYGFIDTKGDWAIQPIFEGADSFKEGLARVEVNGKWGFVDKQWNFVIEPLYEVVLDFSDNLAAVKINGKWGFVDQKGKLVILPIFYGVLSFSNGLAAFVYEKYGKIGFIDKQGNVVVEPMYTNAYDHR